MTLRSALMDANGGHKIFLAGCFVGGGFVYRKQIRRNVLLRLNDKNAKNRNILPPRGLSRSIDGFTVPADLLPPLDFQLVAQSSIFTKEWEIRGPQN